MTKKLSFEEIKELYDQYISSNDDNKKAIIETLRKDEYDIKNNKPKTKQTEKLDKVDKLLDEIIDILKEGE